MIGGLSLRPVCLIGPPAAGKTTLAGTLSRALDTPVLRPRDLINRTVGIHPATVSLFYRNARGRVPDESLGFALRVCLDLAAGTVIFESLPWDAIQLADLYRVGGHRVLVLHLRASDELVTERRLGRQYCASCYPRSTSNEDGIHCARCGEDLTPRVDDEDDAFAERLQIYRANAARLTALARELGVNVFNLDAASSPGALASQALALVGPASNCLAA